MSEECKEYPQAVTENNFEALVKRAEKIRETKYQYFFGYLMFPLLLVIIIMIFAISYWISPLIYSQNPIVIALSSSHASDAVKIAVLQQMIPLILISALIAIPFFYLAYYSWFWFVYRYSGIPSLEEQIFSDMFIIANHLKKNERLPAKKQLMFLQFDLKFFCGLFWVSPNREVFSPEFTQLQCGRNPIGRMIMFSKDDLSKLFTDCGLAFVNNDSPSAFASLNALIAKAKEYGEMKGKLPAAFERLERYPVSVPAIYSIAIVLSAIIYFVIFGHVLPIP